MIGTQHINPEQRLGAQLEHALAQPAPVAVGGGWGGLGRVHAPSHLIQYLQRTVLQGMVLVCKAERLVGVPRGTRRDLGVCMLEGRPLTFALWAPHFGIAIDLPGLSDAEVDHKIAWCEDRSLLYLYVPASALRTTTHDLSKVSKDRRCGKSCCTELFDTAFFAQLRDVVAERRRLTLQDAA